MKVKSVKLVFVGDGAVGKTSLIYFYDNCSLPIDFTPATFDSFSDNIIINGSNSYRIGIWDTASHCDYAKLRSLYYQQADVFIVSYSISEPRSLKNVKDKWVPEIKSHCSGTPFILAGLKSDLRDDYGDTYHDNLFVSHREGELFSYNIEANDFIEVSTFKRINVNELFEAALIVFEHHRKDNKKRGYFYFDCSIS